MRSIAVPAIFLLMMVCSFPARAEIIVHIGYAEDKDALFWVETKSNHARIHGSIAHDIDERFMRPLETAKISVWALNPITFSFVYTSIYHPAYLYDSKLVRAMPSALRAVTIPKFEPRSWREFMDSDEKVRHAGQGIHLGNVLDHFNLFIKPYLPAIDSAGMGDNLKGYIPLLQRLISHTEKTLPETTYGLKSIDDQRATDPAYAQRLEWTEQARLKELNDLFSEIKALLSISAEERIRLRSLQAKLVNPGSVYQDLMTAQDRQAIAEFLELQFKNSRAHPKPERTQRWGARSTNILYSITLGDRFTLKGGDGNPQNENCYRTGVSVDVRGGEKTAMKNTQSSFDANFCRNAKEQWVIQWLGR